MTGLFVRLAADSAQPKPVGATYTQEDLEFSVMLHYMSWGEFPPEHPNGVFTMQGTNTEQLEAIEAADSGFDVYTRMTEKCIFGNVRAIFLQQRRAEYNEAVVKWREHTQKPTSAGPSVPKPTDKAEDYKANSLAALVARNRMLKARDHRRLERVELVRVDVWRRIDTALKYLDNLAVNGVQQLNQLQQTSYPAFDDMKPPEAFETIIGRMHRLSIDDAQRRLTYEAMYRFLAGPNTLRITLRRIAQDLAEIAPLQSVHADNEQAQRAALQNQLARACPTLNTVLESLIAFDKAAGIHIDRMRTEMSGIKKDLKLTWSRLDTKGKQKLVKQKFAEAMDPEVETFLDVTHFTDYLREVRAVIAISAQETFCAQFDGFGQSWHSYQQILRFS